MEAPSLGQAAWGRGRFRRVWTKLHVHLPPSLVLIQGKAGVIKTTQCRQETLSLFSVVAKQLLRKLPGSNVKEASWSFKIKSKIPQDLTESSKVIGKMRTAVLRQGLQEEEGTWREVSRGPELLLLFGIRGKFRSAGRTIAASVNNDLMLTLSSSSSDPSHSRAWI